MSFVCYQPLTVSKEEMDVAIAKICKVLNVENNSPNKDVMNFFID